VCDRARARARVWNKFIDGKVIENLNFHYLETLIQIRKELLFSSKCI